MEDTPIQEKKCTSCDETNPLQFSWENKAQGKRKSRCKACEKQRYASQAEEVREKRRQRRARDPEKMRAQNRAYRARYPEKIRAQNQAYRAKNPESGRAQNRAYYLEHREELIRKAQARQDEQRGYVSRRKDTIRPPKNLRLVNRPSLFTSPRHTTIQRCCARCIYLQEEEEGISLTCQRPEGPTFLSSKGTSPEEMVCDLFISEETSARMKARRREKE